MTGSPGKVKAWKSPFHSESAGSVRMADSLLLGNELRDKIDGGKALGAFIIDLPLPGTVTALAIAGFDFVVLDMEHSALDFGRLENLIVAAHAAGMPALVRPWGEDSGLIGKILDMGAHGVMAPHVDGPDRAAAVVRECRFPPDGERGFSPLGKFDCLEEPLADLNRSTYVVTQAEGRSALDGIDAIAGVPGVDAIFVGPYDLALSLGVEPGSDAVYEAAQEIAGRVPDHMALGIYLDDPGSSDNWAARGFALQCVSFDGRMLADGARSVMQMANGG